MNHNHYIFNKIKERAFPEDVNEILQLLEGYLHRIEFVKSIIGLKNVLYFEELDLEIEEDPFFLSIGLEFESQNKHEAFSVLYERAISDKNEILFRLKNFFNTTNHTLYIEVGFSESVLTNDDKFKVKELMSENKNLEPFEAINQLRQFPEWYEAKLAEEIAIQSDLFQKLYRYENFLLNEQIYLLKAQLDECLDKNDVNKYKKLLPLYQDLIKHR